MALERAKVDIVIGFLGAGKTTLINRMLADGLAVEKPVIIENEFGEVGVDGDLIPADSAEVKMLSSGCICCTLRGDFLKNLQDVVETMRPSRILIEPTGLANLDDMVSVVKGAAETLPVELDAVISVVDASTLSEMAEFCGDFFLSQIRDAALVVLTHTKGMDVSALDEAYGTLASLTSCPVVDADGDTSGLEVLAAAEAAWPLYRAGHETRPADVESALREAEEHETEERDSGCGHPHGGRHGHVHAPDGFASFAFRPDARFDESRVERLFSQLGGVGEGRVFRAKGFLRPEGDGQMLHVEYVLGSGRCEASAYSGEPKLVVIGQDLSGDELGRMLSGE